jgi:hypothetical protein
MYPQNTEGKPVLGSPPVQRMWLALNDVQTRRRMIMHTAQAIGPIMSRTAEIIKAVQAARIEQANRAVQELKGRLAARSPMVTPETPSITTELAAKPSAPALPAEHVRFSALLLAHLIRKLSAPALSAEHAPRFTPEAPSTTIELDSQPATSAPLVEHAPWFTPEAPSTTIEPDSQPATPTPLVEHAPRFVPEAPSTTIELPSQPATSAPLVEHAPRFVPEAPSTTRKLPSQPATSAPLVEHAPRFAPEAPSTIELSSQPAVPISPVARPAAAASQPATFHFCTVAGRSYLFKVLTLYRSLESVSNDFILYVCCIDHETLSALERLQLPRCTAVMVDALGDNELALIRSQRSASEYCWTLKSHFLLYLLEQMGLSEAVYLDSDIAFFSSPQALYNDWGGASVYLCRQRDLGWVEQKYGQYQAGVIGFRNDTQGLAALRWWRDKCRAWCAASTDTGLYGDQKYLDEIPGLFGTVKVSTHRGIDAAPWNTVYNNNYPISVSGNNITIDGYPLVNFHFACLDVVDEQHFDLWNLSIISINQTITDAIYLPYLTRLRASIEEIKAKTGSVTAYLSDKAFKDAKTPYIYSAMNMEMRQWDGVYGFCTIASKQYAARTLALYGSLTKHAGNFHLWICCMDETAYAILSAFNLQNATLIRVSEVETPEAKATQSSKQLYEYCWTMKPLLCQYVMEHYNISRLLYCDADIYFFSNPQAIHTEWLRYETFLNLQRGTAELEAKHGMYQAGLVGFTKASESLKALNWWAQQCTAWCYDDHSDSSRWGDQKYLTQIPNLFTSIKVNNKYGMLAAPWNIVMNNTKNLPVHTGSDGTVWLGDEALTCYHFGSINVLSDSSFDLWKHEPLRFDPAIIESIYKPYLEHLRSIFGEIRAKGFDISSLFENGAAAQNPFSI